jgi:hypothetical protein
MKDLIDHMNRCHDQLEWASDASTETFLTESLMVDLSECRTLCEQLRTRARDQRHELALAGTA